MVADGDPEDPIADDDREEPVTDDDREGPVADDDRKNLIAQVEDLAAISLASAVGGLLLVSKNLHHTHRFEALANMIAAGKAHGDRKVAIHADRGPSMTSKMIAHLYVDLGVTQTPVSGPLRLRVRPLTCGSAISRRPRQAGAACSEGSRSAGRHPSRSLRSELASPEQVRALRQSGAPGAPLPDRDRSP